MTTVRRAFLGGALGLAPTLAAAAKTRSLRDQVLGAWTIIDAETVNVSSGAAAPWQGRPRPYTGPIIYSPAGLMSVHIAAHRDPLPADTQYGGGPAEDRLKNLNTYYGYFGRFEVDEALSKVRHFIQSSLDPAETGQTLVRSVSLTGGVLTLTTDNTTPGPMGATFNRLTWTRVKGS